MRVPRSQRPGSETKDLDALLREASARREGVRAVTSAYRLVDDAADGFPGVTVDCYGQWAVLSVYDELASAGVAALANALVPTHARGVHVKHHARGDLRHKERDDLAPRSPIGGESAPDEVIVDENGMHFAVSLHDGLSTGLFTDQRDNRRALRGRAQGVRLLNLFAYTCSFTVAAALGGAAETVSVDLSNRALERGRENLARNGVPPAGHRFIRDDALAFLGRAARRGERFGVVVLDPPSFGTRGRRTFSVERDYGELARLSMALLSPGGRLLAVTNHRKTSVARLQALLADAARYTSSDVATVEVTEPPADHRHRPEGELATKSIWVTLY